MYRFVVVVRLRGLGCFRAPAYHSLSGLRLSGNAEPVDTRVQCFEHFYGDVLVGVWLVWDSDIVHFVYLSFCFLEKT